ncbi:MAG: ferredoxin [Kiritimatiellia bacterium]
MKASVDPTKCTGCGICCDVCPEVFELEGDLAKVKVDIVPPEAEEKCREAEKNCPVEAIALQV